MSYVSIGV